jgi:hypothetical protein
MIIHTRTHVVFCNTAPCKISRKYPEKCISGFVFFAFLLWDIDDIDEIKTNEV